MIRVAAAILWRGGKLLICQRGPGGSCGDLWEFPGGKLEEGETAAGCAVRECREELGIEIRLSGALCEVRHQYPDREVLLSFFEGTVGDGEPEARVHQKIVWVLPAELDRFRFCPADEDLIHRLIQRGGPLLTGNPGGGL